MKLKEMIKRYKRYHENLVHNIKFHLERQQEFENNPYYDEDYKQRMINVHEKEIRSMEGQLMLVREIIFDIQNKRDYYLRTSLDFRVGKSL